MRIQHLCLTLSIVLAASIVSSAVAGPPLVQTGIDVLRDRNDDLLRGKRVGLITNPTGVDVQLNSTIDLLFARKDVKLVALYGPEHGVRGEFAAGDEITSTSDAATGLPVHSLYGKTRKPTPEMLRGIDVLVYDIQDIGCRSYTFISTMGLAMEAAGEAKIPFIVLDRPNPLGGLRIEGNLVAPGAESFVGQYPIPYVYGLTCGELAKFLNDEGILKSKCQLTVVPMKGWRRSMLFTDTGLPWVPPSPHIPHAYSPMYYVSTGIMGELGVISEGVGYPLPFQLFAADWIDPKPFADRMNAQRIEGVRFRPTTIKPYYTKHKDKTIKGVQIYLTDASKVNLTSLQFRLMDVHNQMYPSKNPFQLCEKSRISMWDKVCGGTAVRTAFAKAMKYADVKPILDRDAASFRQRSSKYYLYQ